MSFDSYATPASQRLLLDARSRWVARTGAHRVLVTEAAGAMTFVIAAGTLMLSAPWTRAFDPLTLAATVLIFLGAARITFPAGVGWTRPTQLAFVPMVFLLPLPLVPPVVALCLLADVLAFPGDGGRTLPRLLSRIGDSVYTLGPVAVLLAAGPGRFSWSDWPWLLVAFAAQIVLDAGCGFVRTWFADGVAPGEAVEMAWIFLTDGALSVIGALIAASATEHPLLVLNAVPVLGLLSLLARERHGRLEGTLELGSAYRGTAMLLGEIVEGDHQYTGVHSRAVVELSMTVGRALGLDSAQLLRVEFGALLHDVGKIRVPKSIIDKPGKLTDEEWEVMRRHTIEGEEMLARVGGVLAQVGRVVRASHERFDGGGYPDGLTGEDIPIESRIICACDAYSAMTTDRAYRAARSVNEAVDELRRCSGSQFDPRVVEALTRQLG